MKKRMRWIAGALSVLMLFSLTACGKEKNQDEAEDENNPVGEVTGEPLQLWITTLGEEADIITRVTEEQWNKEHPKTPVEVTVVPGNSDDFYQKLSAAFATENGPDMFCISNAEMLKYVESEIAYDVTKWLDSNKDDYVEGAIEAVTYGDKILAFPGNMDIMGIYCNNTMFQNAGLELPETWDELIETSNALATKDRYGIIIQTDVQSGYQVFEFYPFLWMCNGQVLAEDGSVVFESEAAKKALSFYSELLNAPGTCKKVENSNTDISPFGTERTAMQVCGSWAVSWLEENYEDIDYSVIPYPVSEAGETGSGVIGGWQYMVSSKGKNPEASAEYLNWLWNSGIEIPKETATMGAKISPRQSVLDAAKDYYSQYPMNVFVNEILPNAKLEPSYPAAVVKAVGDALQDAAYSNKSLEDILADTQAKCEKAVK